LPEPEDAAIRREIAARRRQQAAQMLREGATVDAIAGRLAVNRRSVQRMLTRELRSSIGEVGVDERRALHVEALMDIWRVVFPVARQGDVQAIDRFLMVEARLSRLLGIDTPSEANLDLQVPDEGTLTIARRFQRTGDAGESGGDPPE